MRALLATLGILVLVGLAFWLGVWVGTMQGIGEVVTLKAKLQVCQGDKPIR